MSKTVTLSIDGKQVQVPEGTLIVNAARMVGIDIPVFCYHPKMEPVGMCRMCLVDVGRPLRDRATGELLLEEDGSPKIGFGPKLETACTTPVSEGMVVLGMTEKVARGRKEVLEFLLTSHPLDCPICDKGGECPLQNLTMAYGPGESRYLYDEKMHFNKHVPLGELIFLDRERCIQCGRCVRFQSEIAADPVIGFYQRGRSLEIITNSEPGFDSYYSGNTTDICPVGALTTADFRFKARPWELKSAASICTQCPVGCNITFNVRREAASGGDWVIKRAMPRQNEWINEIWICDKGRFGYHYANNDKSSEYKRLLHPLIRRGSQLVPASWGEALDLVTQHFREAGEGLLTLAGGRLSNEDLFSLRQLTEGVGGKTALYSTMAGGDLTSQVGVGQGTNFSDMGPETAILVVASDLQEEAPIWWLRVKQAAERGAKLIVANPRETRLDRFALHKLRYPYGSEAAAVLAMANSLSAKRPNLPETVQNLLRSQELQAAATTLRDAENAVILFGSEGTGLDSSRALAQACANLLVLTNHVGRVNNGLLAVWQRANDQGAWDMGFRPVDDLKVAIRAAKVLYVAGADPAGDDPDLAESGDFMVVQDLYLTQTAKLADVVLPAQAFTEREGSYTSAERRVQRFYPAVPEASGTFPDFAIAGRIGKRLGLDMEERLASKVMARIAETVPDYAQVSFARLAEVKQQWPLIGREDLYYGGTSYENSQGLGLQLAPATQMGAAISLGWIEPPVLEMPPEGLVGVPITRLYDHGLTLLPSKLLEQRIPEPYALLNPGDAGRLGIFEGALIQVSFNGANALVSARLDENTPEGAVLLPRSFGFPINAPTAVAVRVVEQMAV
jgi:NADH-quinone oxidoreductase subunit G